MSTHISNRFVRIPGRDYSVQRTQVTQKQWQVVMGNNPSYFTNNEYLPVESVSWNDCQVFVKNLNAKSERWNYRLPCEEEWEHACRAGSTSDYCFGDDVKQLGDYAWYYDNSNDSTHIVGQKKPNAFGLYDMHGNVWEWTESKWNESGSDRVIRGGSWDFNAGGLRSADRGHFGASYSYSSVGLRLLREKK